MTPDSPRSAAVDAQADRYVALGVPALAGLDEAAFRAAATALSERAAAGPAEDDAGRAADGRLPWLLVVPHVDAAALMALVEVDGGTGYVDMNPTTPDRFATIEDLDVPAAPLYLLRDFSPGDALRDLPPAAAMTRIREAGREPLTIAEGLSALVTRPALLAEKHAFSLLGSRSADRGVAKSVPAVWTSRGRPRLGWCWDGNPHGWLGSASCAERVSAE